MVKRTVLIAAILVLGASFALSAGGSGAGKGTWANHNTMVDTVEVPGGGSIMVQHTKQFHHAEDPDHPLDSTAADCVGVFRLDATGVPTAASGTCFVSDAQGDRMSFWWRQEEAGTESCPGACGSWGFFAGDGTYKGITGQGKWVQSALFPDGGSGTWEGTYSIP